MYTVPCTLCRPKEKEIKNKQNSFLSTWNVTIYTILWYSQICIRALNALLKHYGFHINGSLKQGNGTSQFVTRPFVQHFYEHRSFIKNGTCNAMFEQRGTATNHRNEKKIGCVESICAALLFKLDKRKKQTC